MEFYSRVDGKIERLTEIYGELKSLLVEISSEKQSYFWAAIILFENIHGQCIFIHD